LKPEDPGLAPGFFVCEEKIAGVFRRRRPATPSCDAKPDFLKNKSRAREAREFPASEASGRKPAYLRKSSVNFVALRQHGIESDALGLFLWRNNHVIL
jgi:hypothetical protein